MLTALLVVISAISSYILLYVAIYYIIRIARPLHDYPGPLLNRLTPVPWIIHLWRGTLYSYADALHKQYGPVVRVAPNELSIIDPAAWKDIYRRPRIISGGDFPELPKPDWFFRPNMNLEPNIISADFDTHAHIKSGLAPGFSEKNIREQEPIIRVYIDSLLAQLRKRCGSGAVSVDLAKWFGHATTDIIADLALGESFDCLQSGEGNDFTRLFNRVVREDMVLAGLRRVGPHFLTTLAYRFFAGHRVKYLDLYRQSLSKRVASSVRRPDLIQSLLNQEEYNFDSVVHTAALIIFAGEETTLSVLYRVVYYLASNPVAMETVLKEVRGAYRSKEEITIASVNKLEYMIACLHETMRIYPPVGAGLPRIVPRGAEVVITGHVVPGDTNVAIPPYALNHCAEYWVEPDKFIPERWLRVDKRFASDKLHEGLKPFLVGPRGCIRQNLAHVEMRLILACVLFAFDIELDESCRNWVTDQTSWVTWARPPLYVRLTGVNQAGK